MPTGPSANCHYKVVATDGKHSNDLPQFRWINTLLGNLKTSFSATIHAFNFDKHAGRYLSDYRLGINRRFSIAAISKRIAYT